MSLRPARSGALPLSNHSMLHANPFEDKTPNFLENRQSLIFQKGAAGGYAIPFRFLLNAKLCRSLLISRLKLAAVSVNSALRIKDMSPLFGNVYSVEQYLQQFSYSAAFACTGRLLPKPPGIIHRRIAVRVR
jgi:hypothetical protein